MAQSASAVYRTRLRQMMAPGRPPTRAATPPALPPGHTLVLPGRGEIFIRDLPGPTDATPVLLLHGWIASSDLNWFGAFAAFEGERRVIAVDHRGHGRGIRTTESFTLADCADDAAALLDVLGLPHAVVAGYSMGGPISLLLARRHPDRVRGLVVAATALTFSDTAAERWRWRGLWLVHAAIRLGLGDRLLRRLAADLGGLDPTFEPYTSWMAGEFSRSHPRALFEAGRELARFDARPWAGALGVPAASVITERDSLVPHRRQRALAALLGATVHSLPGADHDVPVTDIASFAATLRAAVDEVDPRPAAQPADLAVAAS